MSSSSRKTEKSETDQRLFHVLDAMPVGVFLLNPDGKPYYANTRSKKMLGKGIMPDISTEQLAETYKAYISDTNTEYPQENMPVVKALSGEFSSVDDMEIQKSQDERMQIQVWGAPIYDSDGNLIFASAIFGDISELKRSEKNLKKTLEDLKRSNEELEQFAYIASHDLQEPLRMVASFTSLLQKRYGEQMDDDANEFIRYAVDGASRMKTMINDLLDYSRLTTRQEEFKMFDVADALLQAILNLRVRIDETGSIVTRRDLPDIKGDAIQITRLFQNLIDNSIKFRSDVAPVVDISCVNESGNHIFSVRDNGIGIDPEFGERIFKIFQRLNSRDKYPGTGIGLAACKRIIELHRGRIWMEPSESGTLIKFSIPM